MFLASFGVMFLLFLIVPIIFIQNADNNSEDAPQDDDEIYWGPEGCIDTNWYAYTSIAIGIYGGIVLGLASHRHRILRKIQIKAQILAEHPEWEEYHVTYEIAETPVILPEYV